MPADDDNRPVADSIAIMATTGAAADRALAAFTAKYSTAHQYELAEIGAWRRAPDLAFAAIGRAWDGLEPNLMGLKTDPLLAAIRDTATGYARSGFRKQRTSAPSTHRSPVQAITRHAALKKR